MSHARNATSNPTQLMAVEVAVRVLINVVNCVETRDIQQAQRHLERRLTLDRAERERWGPDGWGSAHTPSSMKGGPVAREIDYSCHFCGRDHAKPTFGEWWQCPFMRREPLSEEEVQLQMASQIKGDMARRQRDREELQWRAAIFAARWDARQPVQKSHEEGVAEEMDKLKAWAQAHVAEQIMLKVRAAKNARSVDARDATLQQALQAMAARFARRLAQR